MLLKHDPLHSQIEFKVKHLMISQVRGSFKNFQVTMETKDATFNGAKVECEIDVSSINTQIKDRDDHLKSPDFFDTQKHPKMLFKSVAVIPKKTNQYEMRGLLTIKGIRKPVILQATYNGSDIDQYGQRKFGFEIVGTIDRKDWDLTFNVAGGNSTLLIGNEIKLEASIQMLMA
jgi:polyisoprenoid-binding protein YceI